MSASKKPGRAKTASSKKPDKVEAPFSTWGNTYKLSVVFAKPQDLLAVAALDVEPIILMLGDLVEKLGIHRLEFEKETSKEQTSWIQ